MKKISLMLLLATLAVAGSLQAQTNNSTTKRTVYRLKSSQDSLAYAAGLYLANWLTINDMQKVYGTYAFEKAIYDQFAKRKLKMPYDTAEKKLAVQIDKANARKAKKREEKLFAELRKREGIGFLPAGIPYEIITRGVGPIARIQDSVVVNLRGQTLDQVVIANTDATGPETLSPKGMVNGLAEAILQMPAGSKWTVYIPAAQAYGATGVEGIIPANATLIFEVEVLKVIRGL